MPLNTPDMGAVNAMGQQFNTNTFTHINHFVNKTGMKSNAKAKVATRTRDKARNDWASSVNSTLKTAHSEAAKATRAQQSAAKKAATAHAQGVKSGKVAPQPGAAPRTFAMGPTPAQKQQKNVMTQQRNNAHGEALKDMASQAKTMQQQRNYAHGQAIGEQKQRDREAAKVNTPPANPAKKAVPSSPPAGQFPQAKFPTGASTKPLPTASANHSLPDKPQTFTQGAYTHKPGGIAAAGSRLEAWAQTKTMAVNARRKSQAAGGRDKSLAATANQFEAKAAAPLSGQAPTTKEE